MKRWALLFGVMLLFAGIASAQDEESKFEVFGGYSYVRADANLGFANTSLNFNGGSGSIAYNVVPWLGVVGDFGGYHWSGSGSLSGEDATAFSYMFGPKASMHAGPITPFVQALFGGTRLSGTACGEVLSARVRPERPSCGSGSENAFSMALGGGLDWNATPHIGVRLIQAEYYMTQFFSVTQNNARISAGVTFRW